MLRRIFRRCNNFQNDYKGLQSSPQITMKGDLMKLSQEHATRKPAFAHLKNKCASHSLSKRVKLLICLTMAAVVLAGAGVTAAAASLRNYMVTDGMVTRELISFIALDESALLEKTNMTLNQHDLTELRNTDANNYLLTVTRRHEITVTADGITGNYVVNSGNVAEALYELGIMLDNDDVCSLSLSEQIADGDVITVDRVEYATVQQDQVVDYSEYMALVKNSDTLDDDALKQGQTGVVTHVYQNKLVNGEVAESELISQSVGNVTDQTTTTQAATTQAATTQKKPQTTTSVSVPDTDSDAAVAYASNGKAVSCISTLTPSSTIWLDDNGVPLHYTAKYTGSATAYYDAYNTGLTASGRKPQKGYIAVNPKMFPYGTRLYIRTPSGSYIYGYAVAADTGGFVYNSNTIADLYFDTYEECVQFGRRNIEIYVLD